MNDRQKIMIRTYFDCHAESRGTFVRTGAWSGTRKGDAPGDAVVLSVLETCKQIATSHGRPWDTFNVQLVMKKTREQIVNLNTLFDS